MNTIVIGDVHGCFNELELLINNLIKEGDYKPEEDRLIFLGDYIDRGENPRLVIKYIRNLQEKYPNVIALMGNHEDMAVNHMNGVKYSGWTCNGYEYTINSYKGHEKEFKDDIEWMSKLPLYFEDDNFIYVHAGIDLNVSMKKQYKNTLLWVREAFLYNEKPYGKKVIFGHTPNFNKFSPYFTWGNHLCIDTGCVFGGSLTALIIENGVEKEFVSVKKGEKDNE